MYISIREEAGDLEALTRAPLWPRSLLPDKAEPDNTQRVGCACDPWPSLCRSQNGHINECSLPGW